MNPFSPFPLRSAWAFGLVVLLGIGTHAQATIYDWSGGAGGTTSATNNSSNWVGGKVPTLTSADEIYFSTANFAPSGVAYLTPNALLTVGAVEFGPSTSPFAVANSLSASTKVLDLYGLNLLNNGSKVGVLVDAGAAAGSGFYWNSSGPLTTNIGGYVALEGAITFVNNSANAFILNSTFENGTTATGSLILQGGAFLTNYKLNGSGSTLTGGVTIENGSWEVNITGNNGSTGPVTTSPLGLGTITLGQTGSANNATFIFDAISRSNASNANNQISWQAGNNIIVSDGTGARTIQNGADNVKQLYSSITINGTATLTLDNNNEGSADPDGPSAQFTIGDPTVSDSVLNETGLKGTGNLYLTGGGWFYLQTDAAQNTNTGAITVHNGVFQVGGAGSIANNSRLQIDQNGTFDVEWATNATYTFGATKTQVLSGTGWVNGDLLLGSYAILHPGGTDVSGRAGLTFTNDLALNNQTIFDLSSTGYGAVDVEGALTYAGALQLNLGAGFAPGEYDLFTFTGESGDFTEVDVYQNSALIGELTDTNGVWSGTIDGIGYSFDDLDGVFTAQAVPEPAPVALLLLGGVFLLRRNFRRLQPAA
jgi:hypothetical protein